jgi:sugar/nucleoside kinase (ribokinase family)
MAERNADVLVTGHVTLDLTPSLEGLRGHLRDLLLPGTLVHTGPMTVSNGGTVTNVGMALHRLGIHVGLAGKVGGDELGRAILSILGRQGLDKGMIVSEKEDTAYALVIAPPGVDRMFLYYPGVNDTFMARDALEALATFDPAPRIVHFGYPTLMRSMYLDGGKELVKVLSGLRHAGVVVTLDVSQPDPASESGKQDWRDIMAAALPYVDVFMPNIEESLFLLEREQFFAIGGGTAEDVFGHIGPDGVSEVARTILDLGAGVAAVKCGSNGVCVRTGTAEALAPVAQKLGLDLASWKERTLWAEAVVVERIATATGAGDCAVAGFLAAMSRGEGLETAARIACAVGAQNLSAVDTVSGVRSYEETLEQIADCSYRPLEPVSAGWRHLPTPGVWEYTGQGK